MQAGTSVQTKTHNKPDLQNRTTLRGCRELPTLAIRIRIVFTIVTGALLRPQISLPLDVPGILLHWLQISYIVRKRHSPFRSMSSKASLSQIWFVGVAAPEVFTSNQN
jgi:hypothetical protein